jgi:hypothetical protein
VRSNTPLQALATLNEPMFVECAQSLALQTLQHGGESDVERLHFAFRRCTGRLPDSNESATLFVLLGKQLARFSESAELAREMAAVKSDSPDSAPAGVSQPQLAAWTGLCRVLLNLDEVITKQ